MQLKSVKPVSNGALKSDALPSRVKILSWGENPSIDGPIIFDEKSAECFYDNQRSIGRLTTALDYNHNTVKGTPAFDALEGKAPEIFGYGVPTVVAGDGLYYEYMQWTPVGEEKARNFMDISPAVITDSENRVIGLHSCALTPTGKIEALNFFSADSMPNLMDKSAVETKAYASEPTDHKSKYGDVEYADAKNHKYPINTEEHVRAALSYINMPKNQKGYNDKELAEIKSRIAAKAKHFGIEVSAHSAWKFDVKTRPNAYATDPYEGINDMLEEHVKHFAKELGMDENAEPDDVMKMLRAKWEGLKKDPEPLPDAAKGSSVDPEKRNDTMPHDTTPHGTVTYSADKPWKREEYVRKMAAEIAAEVVKPLSAEITSLKAERDTAKAEREANAKALESEQRKRLLDEATNAGKVIPFSAEELDKLPVDMLRTLVKNTKPEVPGVAPTIRTLAAGTEVEKFGIGLDYVKLPKTAGAKERAVQTMSAFFSEHGLARKSTGHHSDLTPAK